MNFINEKGKLFSRINLIDFLVLVFTIIFLSRLVYVKIVTPRLKSKPQINKREVLNIKKDVIKFEVKILFKGLELEELQRLKEDALVMNCRNETIGKIIKINRSSKDKYNIISTNNQPIGSLADIGKWQVEIDFDMDIPIEEFTIDTSTKVIRINSIDKIYINGQEYIGQVISCKEKKYAMIENNNKLNINVRFDNLIPELVNVINKGDEENSADGNIQSRIKTITRRRPSMVMASISEVMTMIRHPYNKDLFVEMEIIAREENNNYFHKGKILKIGQPFLFKTYRYELKGILLGIKGE